MYKKLIVLLILTVMSSCTSKKNILYLQDIESHNLEEIKYFNTKIQINDILSITVSSKVPEAAIPYNIQSLGEGGSFNLEALKLQGYEVTEDGLINFPILGKISAANHSTEEIENTIANKLLVEGHLKDATVNVRLLNAKVTILGEVMRPSTFSFTERTITLPQALGYAGDLTILAKRKDVLLIREENGIRRINHIDLTSADWIGGPLYYIMPNDLIIVNPNSAKVKSAGFIGNAGVVLTIASLILSSFVLISR